MRLLFLLLLISPYLRTLKVDHVNDYFSLHHAQDAEFCFGRQAVADPLVEGWGGGVDKFFGMISFYMYIQLLLSYEHDAYHFFLH